MSLKDLSPRIPAMIGLLAIIPVATYGVALSFGAGATAAVNVVLIILALYVLFGPIPETGHSQSN